MTQGLDWKSIAGKRKEKIGNNQLEGILIRSNKWQLNMNDFREND